MLSISDSEFESAGFSIIDADDDTGFVVPEKSKRMMAGRSRKVFSELFEGEDGGILIASTLIYDRHNEYVSSVTTDERRYWLYQWFKTKNFADEFGRTFVMCADALDLSSQARFELFMSLDENCPKTWNPKTYQKYGNGYQAALF